MCEMFPDDWTEYLPIYYTEQRDLIESWGFNTAPLSNVEVWEMFANLINEACGAGNKYDHETFELRGMKSTCSAMEWILIHGCPHLEFTYLEFPEDRITYGFFAGLPEQLVVSSTDIEDWGIETPVEDWHEPVEGMRRIMLFPGCWIAYIGGRYYHISA